MNNRFLKELKRQLPILKQNDVFDEIILAILLILVLYLIVKKCR